MTPEEKSNWRLFLMAFVLPGFTVWLVYFLFLNAYFAQIFKFTSARTEFNRQFFTTDVAASYPPIDLVVLGDSTAKSALNPRGFEYAFGVNLALNGGTALSAYHVLDRFLASHPKPKCVLYLSQYNWARNYTYFFERLVFYRTLDFRNLYNIWKLGIGNGVFPRTNHSSIGYWIRSIRSYFYIGALPLNLVQVAMFKNSEAQKRKWTIIRRQMIINRGFQDNELRRLQPEEKFLHPELHAALMAPFQSNPTEDFYIRKLIERTEKEGIKLLWAMLPFADSEHYETAQLHQQMRDRHILEIMQNRAHVVQVPMPPKFPRKYYFDFTHLVPEGAEKLQPYFDPALSEMCAAAK